MSTFLRIALFCLLFITAGYAGDRDYPLTDGPLGDLPLLKDYVSGRSSSSAEKLDSNGDCRWIKPGESLTIHDHDGPAVIRHIWMTIAGGEQKWPRLYMLRMYWDGEETPSVESPVGDFFGVGHGANEPYTSLPFTITAEGKAYNCFFPMPYKKHARITLSNEGSRNMRVYWYVDYHKVKKLPRKIGYFHSQYRQEFPCQSGVDYRILNATGDGHYIGCNFSIQLNEPGWFGEGDDFIYVDGAKQPTMKGTGTEDYFCDAWGFRKHQGPFYGCTVNDGVRQVREMDMMGARTTVYRYHLTDPIPFRDNFIINLEHRGYSWQVDKNRWHSFDERADHYSSVAYWYQVEPHTPFPRMPYGKARISSVSYEVDDRFVRMEGHYEGEHLLLLCDVKSGRLEEQELGGRYSNGGQLWFRGEHAGSGFSFPVDIKQNGKHRISGVFSQSWDYGDWQLYVDDKQLGPVFHGYSQKPNIPPIARMGTIELSAGTHTFEFRMVERSIFSRGYSLGMDYLRVEKIMSK
jgi:D-arabinan exo alpha-(1,3)/(1,5)-arabinofuranosidase (non-reducing end)